MKDRAFLFLCLILSGCINTGEKESNNKTGRDMENVNRQAVKKAKMNDHELLQRYLDEFHSEGIDTNHAYYFICLQACPECVGKGVDLARKNAGNPKVDFIFSVPKRRKTVLRKYFDAKRDFKPDNFFLDDQNNALTYGMYFDKPVLYFVGRYTDEVVKFEIFPDNLDSLHTIVTML